MKLQGKVALITGGTTGIGLETAALFHAEGARVFVTGRNADNIAQAKKRLPADVTVLESFAHPQYIGDDGYPHRSRSLHYVFNCQERTYAVSEWVMYDGTLGHGEIAWANPVGVPTFLRIEEGDREASLLAAACGDNVLANRSYPAPLLN